MNKKHNPSDLTFVEHFSQLRNLVICCLLTILTFSIISYFFAENIIGFIVSPLSDVMNSVKSTNRMIYTDIAEGFLTYLKISLFSGIVLSLPIILYKTWIFISPALKINERKIIISFVVSSFLFSILGFIFCYYYIMPLAWKFLLSFQSVASDTNMTIDLEARLGSYIALSLGMMMAFGVAFQLPILLSILLRLNIIKVQNLVTFRRYYIVSIFIVAAMITPPDVVSQLGLAIPLIIFYELVICLHKSISK